MIYISGSFSALCLWKIFWNNIGKKLIVISAEEKLDITKTCSPWLMLIQLLLYACGEMQTHLSWSKRDIRGQTKINIMSMEDPKYTVFTTAIPKASQSLSMRCICVPNR